MFQRLKNEKIKTHIVKFVDRSKIKSARGSGESMNLLSFRKVLLLQASR